MQLLGVNFLNEHEMQNKASDSNGYNGSGAFEYNLRLGDELLETHYSTEQKEAGHWNEGNHDKLVVIGIWEARTDDTCCDYESPHLQN